MASKSSASHRSQQDDAARAHDATDAMMNMTRPFASAADWMAQMFRASELMSQRVGLLHSQAAENLRNARNPVEFAYIQSNLLVRCCQDMMLIGAKLGSEAHGEARPEETVGDAATSAASAAMRTAAPMMEAWQMMFVPPPTGDSKSRH